MPFDVERYQMLRRSTALGVRVRHREVTESTMDDARAGASEGDLPGTAYVAAQQTAGRGREGRSWVSEPGAGLWVTYFLEVPPPGALVSIAAGLAVTDAIEATAGLECMLKWPNDVLYQGKKLCGLLMQSRSTARGVAFVNFGIGINVNASPDELPDGATSLFQITGARRNIEDVERAVLDRLSVRYEEWLAHGSRPGLDAWTERARFLNEPVCVDNEGSQVEGVFECVSDDGALILRTPTGRTTIVAGDLVRGPRPTG